MDEMKSRVYIKTDENNNVIQIEGEYSLANFTDLSECILIEEGAPCDRLNLAQSHYLEKPLRDNRGIPQYKYIDGEIVERTTEEMDADFTQPTQEPTQTERIEAIEAVLLEMLEG